MNNATHLSLEKNIFFLNHKDWHHLYDNSNPVEMKKKIQNGNDCDECPTYLTAVKENINVVYFSNFPGSILAYSDLAYLIV